LKIFENVLKSFDHMYAVFYKYSDEGCIQVTNDRNATIDMMNDLKKKCSEEDSLLIGKLGVVAIVIYHALKSKFNLEI